MKITCKQPATSSLWTLPARAPKEIYFLEAEAIQREDLKFDLSVLS